MSSLSLLFRDEQKPAVSWVQDPKGRWWIIFGHDERVSLVEPPEQTVSYIEPTEQGLRG
jgi:hypothetical protein